MRVLLRFGYIVVLAGLAVGVVARIGLGRKAFGWLAPLTLLPLAAHAAYLLVLAGRAALPPAPTLTFTLLMIAFLAAAGLLARRWARLRPWYAVLLPLALAPVYYVLATVALTGAWESHEYAPDAVGAAVYVLATLFAAALLVPFAPLGRGAGPQPG